MEPQGNDVARRTAHRLAPKLGANLPLEVEALLQGGEKPEHFEVGTVIALATLVLNITKFAWDIHKDRQKDQEAPPPPPADVIARQIRIEIALPSGVSAAQRDEIITAVMAELPVSSRPGRDV